MRIAYLVHNLADPAVGKRVKMLSAFGDRIVLIGFHRDDTIIDRVEGVDAVDLGRTRDAKFLQRIVMVVKRCLRLSSWAEAIRDCDVIVARNLEMLVLAAVARRAYAPRARLVYECLDIHRLLLSRRWIGTVMRGLEGALLDRAALVIVSSPAFLREYFEPRQGISDRRHLPALVVENKMLLPTSPVAPVSDSDPILPPGPPWRIGWYGMIRCRKSLDYLCDLASRHPGLIEVIIRGRPSRTEFEDFDAQIARTPGISFGGLYRPAELGALYRDVHFSWAIDAFEEEANSRWLLPNRVYEGGAYHAVPIALDGTETARWLKDLNIGIRLDSVETFEEFLLGLTPVSYAALKQASCAVPKSAFVADIRDCARLRTALDNSAISENDRASSALISVS